MARHPDLDQLAINTIRTLAIDAIQKANSGHPGTPMALARIATCEVLDPATDTTPAIFSSGISANMDAVISSPTSTVFSG